MLLFLCLVIETACPEPFQKHRPVAAKVGEWCLSCLFSDFLLFFSTFAACIQIFLYFNYPGVWRSHDRLWAINWIWKNKQHDQDQWSQWIIWEKPWSFWKICFWSGEHWEGWGKGYSLNELEDLELYFYWNFWKFWFSTGEQGEYWGKWCSWNEHGRLKIYCYKRGFELSIPVFMINFHWRLLLIMISHNCLRSWFFHVNFYHSISIKCFESIIGTLILQPFRSGFSELVDFVWPMSLLHVPCFCDSYFRVNNWFLYM